MFELWLSRSDHWGQELSLHWLARWGGGVWWRSIFRNEARGTKLNLRRLIISHNEIGFVKLFKKVGICICFFFVSSLFVLYFFFVCSLPFGSDQFGIVSVSKKEKHCCSIAHHELNRGWNPTLISRSRRCWSKYWTQKRLCSYCSQAQNVAFS